MDPHWFGSFIVNGRYLVHVELRYGILVLLQTLPSPVDLTVQDSSSEFEQAPK